MEERRGDRCEREKCLTTMFAYQNPASLLHIFLIYVIELRKRMSKEVHEGRKEWVMVVMESKEDAYSTPRA